MRREGRPSEKAILASRQIDRPMRPLFPKDLRNDVSIVCTVLENDYDNSPEVVALLGASIAVSISDIPFDYVVGGCQVGIVDGKVVINPTSEQRKRIRNGRYPVRYQGQDRYDRSRCKGSAGGSDVQRHCMEAHEEIKKICAFIQGIKDEIGKPKFEYEHHDDRPRPVRQARGSSATTSSKLLWIPTTRPFVTPACVPIVDAVLKQRWTRSIRKSTALIWASAWISCRRRSCAAGCCEDGKRVDGRGMDEVRPLAAEVGRSAARTRFRHVHPRSDPGSDASPPWVRWAMRRMLDGIDEENDQALYPPLQLCPSLLGR